VFRWLDRAGGIHARTGQVCGEGLSWLANGLWYAIQPLYRISPNPSFTPAWSDKPLLKSREKFRPPLGVPREATSLCPACTREARQAVVDNKATPELFTRHHAGEIPAQIIERDGKIWMVKDCPKHGHFEDVLSTDPAFFKKMEEMDRERTFPCMGPTACTSTARARSGTGVVPC